VGRTSGAGAVQNRAGRVSGASDRAGGVSVTSDRAATVRRALVLLGCVGATAVVLAVIPGHRGWFDVGVYYGAVHHWADTGQLYDYLRPGTPYGFTYPPFAAVCMLPMLLVGWHTAVAISVVLGALATGLLLYWLVDPVARREGWPRWYAFGLAACLCALLNPVRDTFSFGQVNLLLVALVLADWRLGGSRHARYGRLGGIGTGLAAALKLTPALFICYLLLTRPRAALTATATALAATALGYLLLPDASAEFWTSALWDTGRVGRLGYISNQSLQGLIARLPELLPLRFPLPLPLPLPLPERALWASAVLAVLAVWARRVRRAVAAGDDLTGWALTGLACCLISPITWVHHLVWTFPALVLLADAALRAADPGRRLRLLVAAWAAEVILCSGVVWLWHDDHGIGGLLGGNAYVYVTLALLAWLPIRESKVVLHAPPGRVDVPAGAAR